MGRSLQAQAPQVSKQSRQGPRPMGRQKSPKSLDRGPKSLNERPRAHPMRTHPQADSGCLFQFYPSPHEAVVRPSTTVAKPVVFFHYTELPFSKVVITGGRLQSPKTPKSRKYEKIGNPPLSGGCLLKSRKASLSETGRIRFRIVRFHSSKHLWAWPARCCSQARMLL